MPEKHNDINQYLVLGLVILVVILGFLLALVLFSKKQTADYSAAMAGMQLKAFDVGPTELVPTIAMTASSTADGWNIHFDTTNFTFTPQNIDGAPVPGHGHIHLYVDGQLIVVLAPWYHLAALTPGTHVLRAVLANNDHSIYEYGGKYIESDATITQPVATQMAPMTSM